MKLVTDFKDYQILDMAHGEKLESWGDITLIRPDPQIIWKEETTNLWKKAQARYKRSNTGGGAWEKKTFIPEAWVIKINGF